LSRRSGLASASAAAAAAAVVGVAILMQQQATGLAQPAAPVALEVAADT
jgi:hypothetical protein